MLIGVVEVKIVNGALRSKNGMSHQENEAIRALGIKTEEQAFIKLKRHMPTCFNHGPNSAGRLMTIAKVSPQLTKSMAHFTVGMIYFSFSFDTTFHLKKSGLTTWSLAHTTKSESMVFLVPAYSRSMQLFIERVGTLTYSISYSYVHVSSSRAACSQI